MKNIRVRFAPSPTGYLHIGGLRTALYNYYFARKNNGKFLLRIEDTDRTRLVKDAVENLIKILEFSGIEIDEGPILNNDVITEVGDYGPYVQSERLKDGIYQKYAKELIDKGYAYYCFCSKERLDDVRNKQKEAGLTPRYDKKCKNLSSEEVKSRINNGEDYVIRLKLPENLDITFHDEIKGDITFNTDEMDDQVLIKADGFPTYHFAVVVDDHLMEISHVIRGEEWISSTPKHVYLYDCFGWEKPKFIHLPTVLGEDHKKLSKRTGDVAVEQFVQAGFLKDAIVNYISLVGWSHSEGKEKLTMKEMIDDFSFDRVANTGGVFDRQKLQWLNGLYMRELAVDDVVDGIFKILLNEGLIDEGFSKSRLRHLAVPYQTRIDKFSDIIEHVRTLFEDKEKLKNLKEYCEIFKDEGSKVVLKEFLSILKNNELDDELAKKIPKMIQNSTGIKGKDLWFPLRACLTGSASGPDYAEILMFVGKNEAIERIQQALNF